jgi:hypothetical protein
LLAASWIRLPRRTATATGAHVADKALRVFSPFVRFELGFETLCALPLALFAWLGVHSWRALRGDGRTLLCVVMVAAFLVMYCVLPVSQGHGYDVDIRVLVPMYTGLLLLILVATDAASRHVKIAAWTAAVWLALGNLALLNYELLPLDQTIGAYRALLQTYSSRTALCFL